MSPGGKKEDIPRNFVYKDAGVPYSVLILRKPSVFAHVHGYNHGAPSSAAVRGAAYAHIDVSLEVVGIIMPNVEGCDEGALL